MQLENLPPTGQRSPPWRAEVTNPGLQSLPQLLCARSPGPMLPEEPAAVWSTIKYLLAAEAEDQNKATDQQHFNFLVTASAT
ncbi:uncharacterized protein ACBT44_003541 isoform 3-T3 [Syngnathus typhle]